MAAKSSYVSYESIIFVISIVLSLSLLLLDSKGILYPVKGGMQTVISPTTNYFYSIKGKGLNIFFPQSLAKDEQIENLKNENANLVSQLTQLKTIEEENDQMRRLLGTNLPPSWQFSPAKVIEKTADTLSILADSNPQNGTLVILPRDDLMPQYVRQSGIFVGKVDDTTSPLTKVLLPTSNSSKIAVAVRSKENYDLVANGIIVGRGSRALLDQVLVSQNLNEGDWILTQGESLGLREELLIGKVVKVIPTTNSTFKQAEISLIVDSTKLTKVFLITKK